MMVEWIKIVVLGIVQGLTEYLPISSTGHLLVFAALLDFKHSMEGTFEIFIQIGTWFAVIIYFRKPLFYQFRNVHRDTSVRKLWRNVTIGSIPMAIVGVLFADYVTENIFPEETAPRVIAATLILGGFIFLWIETHRQIDDQKRMSLSDIRPIQALLIGVAQAFAIIPGTSRSGSTIVGGLLVGLDRKTATEFSFYLALPALGGATTLQLLKSAESLQRDDLAALLVGTIVSGIVGWAVIAWLLQYVANNDFRIFGYYRIVAGILLIALIVVGTL